MIDVEPDTVRWVSIEADPPVGNALPVSSLRAVVVTDEEPGSGCGDRLDLAFDRVTDRMSTQPAVTTTLGTYSYAWLSVAAARIADRLQSDDNFRPGGRIILLQQNSPEYVASFFGVLAAGGIVVPLPPDIEQDRLRYVLETTQPSHLLSQPSVPAPRCDLADRQIPLVRLTHQRLDRRVHRIPREASPDEPAAILFTSGSSGSPKGVVLSHRNLASNARSICRYLNIRSDERPLCVLPFYHAFGNSVFLSHILAGAELVLDGSPLFPESFIEAIVRHNATSLSAVPELFLLLLERSSLGHIPLPSLRYMAVAGGALKHEPAVRMADRIAPASFYVMYGQTEATARLSYLPPERLRDLPDCIGRGIPGVELQVVDDKGVPVTPGQIGEIRARGSNIMRGYWQDSAATSETIRDGWLHTGDLATVDEQGWIFVKGRRSSLVKIAGYRFHPTEVEQFVMKNFPIQQAVVVPFERNSVGTRLALYARLGRTASGPDISAVRVLCRRRLPPYKVPDHIEFVDEFPLTDSLKIDRSALSKLAQRAAEHRASA